MYVHVQGGVDDYGGVDRMPWYYPQAVGKMYKYDIQQIMCGASIQYARLNCNIFPVYRSGFAGNGFS